MAHLFLPPPLSTPPLPRSKFLGEQTATIKFFLQNVDLTQFQSYSRKQQIAGAAAATCTQPDLLNVSMRTHLPGYFKQFCFPETVPQIAVKQGQQGQQGLSQQQYTQLQQQKQQQQQRAAQQQREDYQRQQEEYKEAQQQRKIEHQRQQAAQRQKQSYVDKANQMKVILHITNELTKTIEGSSSSSSSSSSSAESKDKSHTPSDGSEDPDFDLRAAYAKPQLFSFIPGKDWDRFASAIKHIGANCRYTKKAGYSALLKCECDGADWLDGYPSSSKKAKSDPMGVKALCRLAEHWMKCDHNGCA